MPRRFGHEAGDGSVEAQLHLHLFLVRDDAPRAPEPRLNHGRIRRLEEIRSQRQLQDAVQLEGPDGATRLVEPDQVQRPGRGRRLEQVRVDARLARRTPRAVCRRVVGELHNAAFSPGAPASFMA